MLLLKEFLNLDDTLKLSIILFIVDKDKKPVAAKDN